MSGYSSPFGAERTEPSAGEAPIAARPLIILHVDDDPLNRRVVRDILSVFGHVAVEASNGPEALEQLALQAFDLLLMDVHMPGMSGLEVIDRLRHSFGPNRDAPAIALTADVLSRSRADYLLLGFDDFVAKPILVSELRTAIGRAAVRAHEPTSDQAHTGT